MNMNLGELVARPKMSYNIKVTLLFPNISDFMIFANGIAGSDSIKTKINEQTNKQTKEWINRYELMVSLVRPVKSFE